MSGLTKLFPVDYLDGVPLGLTNCLTAADSIMKTAAGLEGSVGGDVHFVNAYTFSVMRNVPEYRSLLVRSCLNLPDGKPLEWAMRRSSPRLRQIRGPSFFTESMDVGRSYGVRHFLLGGSEETLRLLSKELWQRFPGVTICGTYSPPFRPLGVRDLETQDQVIRAANPDVIWVGLGTPKQDFEAARLASTGAFLAIAVGAAFDFVAGSKREAPAWLGKMGLEWLFRLATEPRRLWRRYLIGNCHFLLSASRHLLRG